MIRGVAFLAAFVALGALWAAFAHAERPKGVQVDPAIGAWYQGLRQPDTGISCCNAADCRTVEYRTVADHYEVFIKNGEGPDGFPGGTNEWVAVPAGKILKNTPNPTGFAVACWTPGGGVLCFVQGGQT